MNASDFCSVCHNLYIIQQNDENTMKGKKVCRFCDNSKDIETAELISHRDFTKKTVNLSQYPIQRIVESSIVATIQTRECPNCKKENTETKLYEIDEEQKKFLYICTTCKEYWTNFD